MPVRITVTYLLKFSSASDAGFEFDNGSTVDCRLKYFVISCSKNEAGNSFPNHVAWTVSALVC